MVTPVGLYEMDRAVTALRPWTIEGAQRANCGGTLFGSSIDTLAIATP